MRTSSGGKKQSAWGERERVRRPLGKRKTMGNAGAARSLVANQSKSREDNGDVFQDSISVKDGKTTETGVARGVKTSQKG